MQRVVVILWAGLALLGSCQTKPEAPLPTLKKLAAQYQEAHGIPHNNREFFDYLSQQAPDAGRARALQSFYLLALLEQDSAFAGHLSLSSPEAIASLDYHLGADNPYRSLYQEQLEWYYQNRQGRQAIDLVVLDTAGREVRLSTFDEKAVYIDTQASWCAPCMEQLPYLHELAREYAEKKDFIILTLSFDKSLERWKKALSNQQSFSNIVPLFVDGGMQSEYTEQFLISSIPHYALLGKGRAIVEMDAPKPGTTAIRKLIDEQIARE